MSHLPQDLHDIFPDDEALLRRLKAEDRHFQALADRYGVLDQEIGQIGMGHEAASDERLEALKKARLQTLDALATVLANARSSA